jgi:hypothetical protein
MRSAILLCVLLAGCQTDQSALSPQERLQNAKDDETCRSAGTLRGTYAYDQCRNTQTMARAVAAGRQ